MRPRARLSAAVAPALALALSGCGLLSGNPPPIPCPKVFLTQNTSHLTRFRPGPGRDITDVDYQADISGYTGSCAYEKDKVSVDLNIAFDVTRGPANKTRHAAFEYFVAIPKIYPSPAGKGVFDVEFDFSPDQTEARFGDEIEIDVPLKKMEEGPSYEIYVGFQLTPAELEYNRTHHPVR